MKKILIALVIILVIVLAGSGTGFYFAFSKIHSEQAALQSAQNTAADRQKQLDTDSVQISNLQSQNTDLNSSLEKTQADLDSTTDSLNETKSSLSDYQEKYDEAIADRAELETECASYEDGYNNTKLQLDAVNQELADAQSKIDLMKDTFGDVAAGVLPRDQYITDGQVADHERLFNLKRNSEAANPTWAQLKNFLQNDYTDEKPYVDDVYTCGNFAEDIFNDAEAAGIRAAVVCITLKGLTDGHALNAFKTTDQGLVYIDCTGEYQESAHPRMVTRVDMKVGDNYVRNFVFQCNYYFTSMGMVDSISIFW